MTEKNEADAKQLLQNDEVEKVVGGCREDDDDYEARYVPYTDTHITVHCPKCNSQNIWYQPAFLGISELEHYWCKNCDNKFGYDDLTSHGASNDW